MHAILNSLFDIRHLLFVSGQPVMSDESLVVHSLAEAYLYLMATPCCSCGRGPLKGADSQRVAGAEPRGVWDRLSSLSLDRLESRSHRLKPAAHWQIEVTCAACQSDTTLVFQLQGFAEAAPGPEAGETAVVNPTDEPSHIVDVGQWIMLFRMITEAASKETDKTQARHLGIEAAQCLEEALKFYDEVDNDLPPPEAVFTDASRERFRKVPQQFSKRRLIDLRSKLPSAAAMRASLSQRSRKRWWRRQRED